MDIIIRKAKLRNQEEFVDIAIKNGKFAKVASTIEEKATTEISANGNLVSPPFVESHVHLDAALSAGNPRFNQSGTLIEAIDIWSETKATLTKEQFKANAKRVIQWLVSQGVLKIRTHTDFTPTLDTLEAILELKDELREYVDIQVVAFPQNGIFSYEGTDLLLEEALQMGADVIGGLPQVELTREDGIKSIEYIFELADKYHKPIDIHTDETTDDQSRFLEIIAKYTIYYGMEGLVTASHTTAMHNYNNDYAAKVIGNVKRAGVHIVTNPFSNTILQNRLDGYPKNRGITRIDELLEAGVNVSVGNDNIMDPFGPLGTGNLLQAAHLLVHAVHFSGHEQIKKLFDMITINGAKTLNDHHDYGIKEGNQADCIILDARDEKEAIRLTSDCLYVIRKGKVISETVPAKRKLKLNESTFEVDFKV